MTDKRLTEILTRLKKHYSLNLRLQNFPEYSRHQISKDGKDITLLDCYEGDENAYRLIVINHFIPTSKSFVSTNNRWRKLAEPLGPLDEEIYNLFHNINR